MIILISVFIFFLTAPAHAKTPMFVALTPNINDFGRFADGGPDGSWYVGFNNAWIVELSPAPSGDYARAFVGAKLGRAKTRSKAGRTWDREIIPGKIYIGISPTPSFASEQSFFLAETFDIPLESDPKTHVSGIGQSQWFWAEIPIRSVNFSGANYLIVWSPTDDFQDATTAPIIAAADPRATTNGGATRVWANRSIQGVPPRRVDHALETPINNLFPALAIKLIPANDNKVIVQNCSLRPVNKHSVFSFSVMGTDIDLTWLEISEDQLDWQRASKFLRQPPYVFNVSKETLTARGAYIRAVAQDFFGNQASCSSIFIDGTNDILP